MIAGLTYISGEASKRDEMGIFILNSQYSLHWDNSSNKYNALFVVSGIISNEGPRSCQVNQVVLHVVLPLSKNSTYYPAQAIEYYITVVNGTYCILNWDNTVFEVGSQKNFAINLYLPNLDNSISNFQNTDIKSSIHLEYNDVLGTLVNDHSVTDWIQNSTLY